MLRPLWAVHISDNVLAWPWLVAGFALAGLLALVAVGAARVRTDPHGWDNGEEELARTALLTAAFFVASLVHVPVGATSAHLLLNGLMGVVLGWKVALAIPVGLLLQAVLIGHGGFTSLGVNSCVMVVPALLAVALFRVLNRLPWVRLPWCRAALVGASTLVWLLSMTYGTVLLCTAGFGPVDSWATDRARHFALHPVTLTATLAATGVVMWLERRLENVPEFPLGLLIGGLAVLATSLLNSLVLAWGGQEDWRALALVSFVAHLPVAVVEGIVTGFAVGFLVRVKPEMLGWEAPGEVPCAADPQP